MRFGNFSAIHLIWVVIALALFYLWAFRKKKAVREEFAQKDLVNKLMPSLTIRRQNLKASLIVIAAIFIVISFMRPQWGFKWHKVKRKGLDIIIALDTSKSMLAEDVKPNRLERAKLAIIDFTKHLKGDRIGLITFAGEAFLECPLTVDYGGFIVSLRDVNVNVIPRGGTSISSAIKEAVRSYEGGLKKYKVLILITDGEDHEGYPIEAAKEAKKEGIKIFCIGIGTPEGDLIPITEKGGRKTFLKDKNGNVVKTRLDEETLKKIALFTGGDYIRSGQKEFGLNLIYKKKLSKMGKREIESKMVKQYGERFQIPLFIAFIILLAEVFISESREK